MQKQLISDINVARVERKERLSKAELLLESLDDFIMITLGVVPAIEDTRRIFAARRADVQMRLDSHYHAPMYRMGT